MIKKPKYKIEYLSIIFDILFKRYKGKYLFFRQGNNIKVKSDKILTWTIDGEYGGRTKEVNIKIINKVLTFVVPK